MINITCPTIRITFDKFNKKHFRAFHSPKILHFSRIGFAFRKIGNYCQNGKIANILGHGALLTSWFSSAWATKADQKKNSRRQQKETCGNRHIYVRLGRKEQERNPWLAH